MDGRMKRPGNTCAAGRSALPAHAIGKVLVLFLDARIGRLISLSWNTSAER